MSRSKSPRTLSGPRLPPPLAEQARVVALRAELVGRLDRLRDIVHRGQPDQAPCPPPMQPANPVSPTGL